MYLRRLPLAEGKRWMPIIATRIHKDKQEQAMLSPKVGRGRGYVHGVICTTDALLSFVEHVWMCYPDLPLNSSLPSHAARLFHPSRSPVCRHNYP